MLTSQSEGILRRVCLESRLILSLCRSSCGSGHWEQAQRAAARGCSLVVEICRMVIDSYDALVLVANLRHGR